MLKIQANRYNHMTLMLYISTKTSSTCSCNILKIQIMLSRSVLGVLAFPVVSLGVLGVIRLTEAKLLPLDYGDCISKVYIAL